METTKKTIELIQFIQSTPEQLREDILKDFKHELDQLKKDFQPKEPSQYLTREDVATMLQIDLSTLWAWTKKSKLKSYSIGNRVYYKRHEIEFVIDNSNQSA